MSQHRCYSSRGIVCPYFGHLHNDSWEWFPNGEGDREGECESCEKPIFVSLSITYNYTSKAMGE